MPIKLDNSKNSLLGGPINGTKIKKMVDKYRSDRIKDKNSLKFAHFTVLDILVLLYNNGIIADPSPISNRIEKFGIKVYLANHANDPDTCPIGRERRLVGKKHYLDSDTVVICNTKIDDTKTYKDMLDKHNWVGLAGAGDGLDKGSICPPDCPPEADNDGNYHEDIS